MSKMIKAAVLFISLCSYVYVALGEEIAKNIEHYGCWKSTDMLTSESLCISSDTSTLTIIFKPNISDTVCSYSIATIGFSQGGSRLYLAKEGTCTGGHKPGDKMYECRVKKPKLLVCDNVYPDMESEKMQLKPDYTREFRRVASS